MASRHIFVSFILLLIYITGSSSGDTVYVQTGASVHLDIQRDQLPDDIENIYWEHIKINIVKYDNENQKVKIYPPYEKRVEFNNKTFSLTLKNMQKNDSGDYTAKIIGTPNTDITVRVSVIDAVQAPVLSYISISSSSDSCTVNFTCRGHNLTLSYSHNNGSCSPEEVTSPEKHTLTLICSEEYIICNHSNLVSSKTDKRDIKQLCEISENPEKHEDSRNHLYWVTGCVFGCIALILAGFCIWKRNKESPLTSNENGGQQVNTVYEGVNGSQPLETITTEPHTCDFPDNTQEKNKDNETSTIYHLVGQPANPPVAAVAVTDHTIYSQVCKVPAKKPDAN